MSRGVGSRLEIACADLQRTASVHLSLRLIGHRAERPAFTDGQAAVGRLAGRLQRPRGADDTPFANASTSARYSRTRPVDVLNERRRPSSSYRRIVIISKRRNSAASLRLMSSLKADLLLSMRLRAAQKRK